MYKITIIRSCLNHFYWILKSSNNKKIAESQMLYNKEICMKVVNPISKKLKAKIEFVDLEKDWIE